MDLKEHFAIQHSLSPFALRTFRSASNTAASQFKSLGSSSSDTFLLLLTKICQKPPPEIFNSSFRSILTSLSGYSAEIRLATLILYNELMDLQRSGSSLDEATTALASRFDANSCFPPSSAPTSHSKPIHTHAHLELEQLISPIQLSDLSQHKTHFSQSTSAPAPRLGLEQINDPQISDQEHLPHAEEEGEVNFNDFDSASSLDSSHSSEFENDGNSDLDDDDEPSSQQSNSRKRRHQEVAVHRSDLLEKMKNAPAKRKCLPEVTH